MVVGQCFLFVVCVLFATYCCDVLVVRCWLSVSCGMLHDVGGPRFVFVVVWFYVFISCVLSAVCWLLIIVCGLLFRDLLLCV